ncbi:MAG: CvpA family protein [Erysipelotrichaceae bacterium]|nr:CvpA family protein [Erysipelotrichaceae bacterium]
MNTKIVDLLKYFPFLSDTTEGLIMDAIILVIFLIIVKRAYDKGAIPVVYEILTVIGSVIGAFILAIPASAWIKSLGETYPYIQAYLVPLCSTIWIVIIVYALLILAFRIIEMIFIHFAEDMVEKWKPTKWLSKIIAVLIGAVKGIIIVSLIVTFLMTTVLGDVSASLAKSHVAALVVEGSNKVIDLTVDLNDKFHIVSNENIEFASQGILESSMVMMVNGYKNGLISKKVAADMIEKNYMTAIYEVMPMMNSDDKAVMNELIDATSLTDKQKADLKDHIIERS